MKKKLTFRGLFESARSSLAYSVERAIIAFTEQVLNRMSILKMSRTQLASELGASPAYVTKMLGGTTNFTIESMVRSAKALDCELRLELVPRVSPKVWISVIEEIFPAPKAESATWCERCRERGEVLARSASLPHHNYKEREEEFFSP